MWPRGRTRRSPRGRQAGSLHNGDHPVRRVAGNLALISSICSNLHMRFRKCNSTLLGLHIPGISAWPAGVLRDAPTNPERWLGAQPFRNKLVQENGVRSGQLLVEQTVGRAAEAMA